MNQLETQIIQCPYCGENISMLIDCSESQQVYIEDCQVCCHPINFNVSITDDGEINILATHDND